MSGDRALYKLHTIHIVRRLFDARRSGTVTSFFATSFFFIYISHKNFCTLWPIMPIYTQGMFYLYPCFHTRLVIILKQQTHKWIQLLRINRVLRESDVKRQSNSVGNNKNKKQNTITNILLLIRVTIITCVFEYRNLMFDDNIICSFIYHIIIRRRLF